MTPRQVPLFRLFGFEVKLDLSWLLIALLITWTLAAGLFPESYPGLSRQTYWWMGIAGAVGIFFSIVFHEFCHSFVARHYGLNIRGITLFIFGGVAEMEKEPTTPKSEFLMAGAGPLASFLLAFIFQQIHLLATNNEWSIFIIGVTYYLAYLNTILAVFNLVPAFPLDGGRMLRAALWAWKQDLRWATRIASAIGSGFGLALMAVGVLWFIQGYFVAGMWWFLIGVFLRFTATASYKQILLQQALQDQPVSRFMTTDPQSVGPDLSLDQLVQDYIYRYHFKMFPVIEDSRLLGCITTREIKQIPQDQWPAHTVGEFTIPYSNENSVSPDMQAMQLLSRMTQPNASSRYLVVKDNQLLGIMSLTDLKEYLALKLELESPNR